MVLPGEATSLDAYFISNLLTSIPTYDLWQIVIVKSDMVWGHSALKSFECHLQSYHSWPKISTIQPHCEFLGLQKWNIIDHLHSYTKQTIWRSTSKFWCSTDQISHENSFVYKCFPSNRAISASGLYSYHTPSVRLFGTIFFHIYAILPNTVLVPY